MRILIATDRAWLRVRSSAIIRWRCARHGHLPRPDITTPTHCSRCGRRAD